MSTPNFSELLKINKGLAEIEALQKQSEELKAKLEETEARLARQMETEKYRLSESLKQKKLLEKIDEELQALRQEEFDFSMQARGKISQAIESFFAGGGFAGFVDGLIKQLEKAGQKIYLVVSDDTKDFVKDQKVDPAKQPGQLRVVAGEKTYILDPERVKESLQSRLLVQVLAK